MLYELMRQVALGKILFVQKFGATSFATSCNECKKIIFKTLFGSTNLISRKIEILDFLEESLSSGSQNDISCANF